MRLLGIDYGSKNIGLALGDTESSLAVPLKTIPHTGSPIGAVVDIIHEEMVERVVIGAPVTFLGGEQEIGTAVAAFCAELRKHGVDVVAEDERLTTRQVERAMRESGSARKAIDKDAAAAALILQTYLDRSRAV